MPTRFINPNLHVILIHYPLGVFVLGVFLELFSFLWRGHSIRIAARWMIVIGALLTLPAATSGIFALADVRTNQGIGDARREMLRWHVIYMGIASILAVACAVIGMGSSDEWRKKLYVPLLAGVVAAWGLMVAGAWHGGETIYQQGTSVAIITMDYGQPGLQALKPPERSLKKYDDVVNYYVGGELQQHLIVAGFSFAAAMGALGLSLRRLNSNPIAVLHGVGVERTEGAEPRRVTDDMSVVRSFNPGSEIGPENRGVPAGRFWLLTALIAISAAGLGYWVMTGSDVLTASGWVDFVDPLKTQHKFALNRHMAHLVLGGAFVVLSLACALVATVAPKKPILLTLFATLLVLVVSAQIWMGILLTFDGKGPLFRFKRPEEKHVKIDAAMAEWAPRHAAG